MKTKTIIPCAGPFKLPKGYEHWTIESHQEMAEVDLAKVELYLSEKQKTSYILGEDLLKEIPNPLNANVLFYLFDHQELIPKSWENFFSVSFFGTVLRDPHGDRYVLCLGRGGGGSWCWSAFWLGLDWRGHRASAAFPASGTKNLDVDLPLDARFLALESRVQKVEAWMKQCKN